MELNWTESPWKPVNWNSTTFASMSNTFLSRSRMANSLIVSSGICCSPSSSGMLTFNLPLTCITTWPSLFKYKPVIISLLSVPMPSSFSARTVYVLFEPSDRVNVLVSVEFTSTSRSSLNLPCMSPVLIILPES